MKFENVCKIELFCHVYENYLIIIFIHFETNWLIFKQNKLELKWSL